MSDSKVVHIRDAIKSAKPASSRKKKGTSRDDGPPPPPPPGDGFYGPPGRLPEEAPVRALGRYGSMFYFLDCKGQFKELPAAQISRNEIIALFGGSEYLIRTWPAFGRDGKPNGEFKHGLLSPVLIASCNDRPLFDPKQRLRSLGAWSEEDGTLVFHCGDILHVISPAGEHRRVGTGLRAGVLYPAATQIPEPLIEDDDGPYSAAGELHRMLKTWNWVRGELDAHLLFGWICASLLGAATEWRPMVWVTGGAGSGKSVLSRLMEWVLGGEDAVIKSDNATAASIFQLVGQSSLPVVLDEVEAKANNKRTHEVVELARLAASGGRLTRGGADGTPMRFQAKNCFFFSSILIPPLRAQDISRMTILQLNKIEWDGAKQREDVAVDADDELLGRRKDWIRVGRALRGALIREWPRYKETMLAYRRALSGVGHDARGADQFGALGAAMDCACNAGFDPSRAMAWAKLLPAKELAETRARQATEYACLAHLLSAQLDVHRSGTKSTIAQWLISARAAKLESLTRTNDNEADGVLKAAGVKLFRDKRERTLWWIGVSHTHQEIAKIFAHTDWSGEPGTTGTWAQALARVKDADDRRLRIGRTRHYVTLIPWDQAFPPEDETADVDELELVDDADRENS